MRAIWWCLVLPVPLWAAPAVSSAPAATPSALMGLLQVVIGLAVVIALILGCAWLFRRLSNNMVGIPRHLRVVSAVMVGQRERVVIVELGSEWLVLGVTAQSVNLLSTQPKPENFPGMTQSAVTGSAVEPFARWFKAALDRRRGPSDDLK
jgi:flagellar protein FliO/FliZ